MLHSYPNVYQLGHKLVSNVLDGYVLVQEKIDGSQISFGIDNLGDLRIRSKNKEIDIEHPDDMFRLAVEWIVKNRSNLQAGWTYRGEYLQKSKHNTLAY